jgi:hypothetical protein
MRFSKVPTCLLVAALVLVPSLARAAQKLDRRPDLKPSASFRDVDRPPEPVLVQIDLAASPPGVLDVPSDRRTYTFVDTSQTAAPCLSTNRRPRALRAPPVPLRS